MWPQYVYLGLVLFGLGFVLSNHGEPQTHYNFFTSLLNTSLALFLLIMGGFFKGM